MLVCVSNSSAQSASSLNELSAEPACTVQSSGRGWIDCFRITCVHALRLMVSSTGWLKIKYPSRQYAISPQPAARFKKNYWSCLILTLLQIEQCTMYPPHLNYATTLPCKTLTMKITIFIIMLVLKSEENIACYQFKTLWKQFISRRVQSVRPQLSHKLEVFWRCSVWPCW